jgi:GDSL-like Lipase/Acylhydrolase family
MSVESLAGVPGRARRLLAAVGLQIAIVAVALLALELVLRVIDLRYLRDDQSERSLLYAYDAELGWFPRPNSGARFAGSRTVSVQHNSLGLRDIEHDDARKPTIMFVGDSFAWGYDVEAKERFTDLLRERLPQFRIVNAGVSGYGTDQEYLLLQRLWDRFSPDVVVLMFSHNDRFDNSTNSRYDGTYKPYFALLPEGGQFRGQPPPKSRHLRIKDSALAQHSLLARLALSAYVRLRHGKVTVSDPTEYLVGMMRSFVEARGARLLVGIDGEERQFASFLQTQNIPYTSFDSATSFDSVTINIEHRYPSHGSHWTPSGHAIVADTLMALFTKAGIRSLEKGGSAHEADASVAR